MYAGHIIFLCVDGFFKKNTLEGSTLRTEGSKVEEVEKEGMLAYAGLFFPQDCIGRRVYSLIFIGVILLRILL